MRRLEGITGVWNLLIQGDRKGESRMRFFFLHSSSMVIGKNNEKKQFKVNKCICVIDTNEVELYVYDKGFKIQGGKKNGNC